jgi:histidinol-phosphate aminotransferase
MSMHYIAKTYVSASEEEKLYNFIYIDNPNNPTGQAIDIEDIEKIVSKAMKNDITVIIDEAYVDFGAESAVALLPKYPNLMVVGTFSKSRSLAGARLGFAVASPEMIADLNTIKYSTNPYNVNRMTAAAGLATLAHNDEAMANCRTVAATRERVKTQLRELGFTVTDSKANFLFAAHPTVSGEALYQGLRARGILVRHFSSILISDYNRITVGTMAEMEALIEALTDITKE